MKNFSIHTSKLNREVLRDIGKGKLNLSKTAIDLIVLITQYVDHDGRIQMDEEEVRKQMFCERHTLERAIRELLNTTYKQGKLLTYENGYYISHFHTSSNGYSTYLKYLPVLTSHQVRNLTKTKPAYYSTSLR